MKLRTNAPNLAFLFSALLSAGIAQAGEFQLSNLPPGKNITLNRANTVIADFRGRIALGSTDLPQTISVAATGVKSA